MIQIGEVIDDMLIIGESKGSGNHRMLHCKCNICNRERFIYEYNVGVEPGTTLHSNCGKDISKKVREEEPGFYTSWRHHKERINNKLCDRYEDYGGRGLTTDYNNFIDFYDDMYNSYIEFKQTHPNERISIDRIDNNLGYVVGNLRWANYTTQARNRRNMKEFFALAPNGYVYLSNNATYMANSFALNRQKITSCLRHERYKHKEWIFRYRDECIAEPQFYIDIRCY